MFLPSIYKSSRVNRISLFVAQQSFFQKSPDFFIALHLPFKHQLLAWCNSICYSICMKINSCPHTYPPVKLPFNRSPSSKFAFRSKADVAGGGPGYDAGDSRFLDREWTEQEWQDWMDQSWGVQVG